MQLKPQWSDLEAELTKTSPTEPAPALTLYRDTNGWCPFCERVWLGLHKKGIPYNEVLINLYDKPQWYKDMVPTTLVPAVKFAESGEIVWESEEILRQLDARFPEAPPLYADPERVKAAVALTTDVVNASMGISYRTGNMTEEGIQRQRQVLIAAIDKLDFHLEREGPFLAGKEVTAADCTAVPMLERFQFQMPLFAAAIELRDAERWPALARWYDTMKALPAYQDRVAGDEYSWTAVSPVLMRLFGSQNGTLPKAAEARAHAAEAVAKQVLAVTEARARTAVSSPRAARLEAAAKLISNRAAVVADVVNTEPKSQKELQRLPPSKEAVVEATLREIASALMSGCPPQPPECDHTGTPCDVADVAAICRFVAARLCAPRDMGAPAADALRRTLFILAHAAEQA
eukprot:CAMPEP_0172770282 /NCGR_PEP_ID=MMETSP1074-20121228/188274_1 /TAXON_ID=2916 /ORGANISM="Ceratium fusus, Strain PA161109" /LENGTH=402 /DNA_ID=CAMNT_0013606015 /DNA_START=207 /DNA_END=1418 /DNA_ORIENTATION=-